MRAETFPGLTGLRGLAALWVVAFHVWDHPSVPNLTVNFGLFTMNFADIIHCGWLGVDLFFVLSGFLLGYQFCVQGQSALTPRSLSIYLRKRILRVIPALYLMLTIVILLVALGAYHIKSWNGFFLITYMLSNISEKFSIPFIGQLWSLPVEFDFYLALPLLAVPVIRGCHPVLFLSVATAASVAFESYIRLYVENALWLTQQLPARLGEFGAGVAAAAWIARNAAQVSRLRGRLAALGLCVVLGLMLTPPSVWLLLARTSGAWAVPCGRRIGISLAFASVVLATAAGQPTLGSLLSSRAAAFLGTVSYGVYLWHSIPLEYAEPLAERYAAYAHVLRLSTIPITITIAAASYALVEKPFLDSKKDSRGAPVSRPIATLAAWSVVLVSTAYLVIHRA